MSYNINEIEVNKLIVIRQTLTNTGKITQNVQLPFMPDYMIVKQITYAVQGPETVNTVRDIIFDLTNDIIGSFLIVPFITDPTAVDPIVYAPVYPNTLVRIRQPIQSDISFTIQSDGETATDMTGGRITIMLDFIRFKVSPPQKTY